MINPTGATGGFRHDGKSFASTQVQIRHAISTMQKLMVFTFFVLGFHHVFNYVHLCRSMRFWVFFLDLPGLIPLKWRRDR